MLKNLRLSVCIEGSDCGKPFHRPRDSERLRDKSGNASWVAWLGGLGYSAFGLRGQCSRLHGQARGCRTGLELLSSTRTAEVCRRCTSWSLRHLKATGGKAKVHPRQGRMPSVHHTPPRPRCLLSLSRGYQPSRTKAGMHENPDSPGRTSRNNPYHLLSSPQIS